MDRVPGSSSVRHRYPTERSTILRIGNSRRGANAGRLVWCSRIKCQLRPAACLQWRVGGDPNGDKPIGKRPQRTVRSLRPGISLSYSHRSGAARFGPRSCSRSICYRFAQKALSRFTDWHYRLGGRWLDRIAFCSNRRAHRRCFGFGTFRAAEQGLAGADAPKHPWNATSL